MPDGNSVTVVAQALRRDARRLPAGGRLPSVRALMAQYRVGPGTVRQAMARLADEGILDARPGQGTFVAPPRTAPADGPPDFSWQGLALGASRVTADGLTTLLAAPVAAAVNLAGGYPLPDLQAVTLVSRAMQRAARRPGVWGRMPLEGLDGLRQWFASQLGGPISAHEVIITPGSQSAITTAFNALAAPGSAVLVESPSYVGALVAARLAGLRLVPVPTDRDGVRPEMLQQALATSGARLFYTQPTHANPTGATLSAERRRQVLDVVAAAGAIVIEDDWCRDLSFERTPARPLVTDDRHGHCVYLRSLTKSTAPGLRIGAIVARGAALARLTACRAAAEFFVSGPLQEAALEVVHSPGWARHLRDVRAALARRRDLLVDALRGAFGESAVPLVPTGGVHLWVRLDDRVDDASLAADAAAAGVLVSAGRQWFPAEPTGAYLRLSFASAPEAQLTRGVDLLARVAAPARAKRRA
jgi:DNA-binding transcriptional MocR family regulator